MNFLSQNWRGQSIPTLDHLSISSDVTNGHLYAEIDSSWNGGLSRSATRDLTASETSELLRIQSLTVNGRLYLTPYAYKLQVLVKNIPA